MERKPLSLFELNQLVRQVIDTAMSHEYWVEAELSECRESRGHCYMELIEKDERNATPVARASAKCWRTQWQMLQPCFERTTGQPLRPGMKVLLKVYPQFHEAFGFSWIVTDIDPTFTLGDMARKRQAIIRQLKDEGVFDMQKELHLPLFCQHIAVISSATAAGYGDFERQLAENPYGLHFTTTLFPAVMQGEGVEQSIVGALNAIYSALDHDTAGGASAFDCVVIIRGGGGTADMSGFDTLALAENVAQFPLPIITGIGHDRDESILDMVSFLRVKTPTAAAALLVTHLKEVLDAINDAQKTITHCARQKMATLSAQLAALQDALPRLYTVMKTRQEARITQLSNRLLAAIGQTLAREEARMDSLTARMPILLQRIVTARTHRLELMEEKVKALDPALLLRRGYSITLKDGRAVRNPALLKKGDEIITRVEKGNIKSIIS